MDFSRIFSHSTSFWCPGISSPFGFPHFSPENLGSSQGQPIAQPAVAGAAADLAAARRGGHQPSSAAAAPGEAGSRGVGAVGGGDGLCQGGLGPVGWDG